MNNLKEIRKANKLSQTELAYKSGVSARHIAFIEHGDRSPSVKTAIKIAKALNSTVEEIFADGMEEDEEDKEVTQ